VLPWTKIIEREWPVYEPDKIPNRPSMGTRPRERFPVVKEIQRSTDRSRWLPEPTIRSRMQPNTLPCLKSGRVGWTLPAVPRLDQRFGSPNQAVISRAACDTRQTSMWPGSTTSNMRNRNRLSPKARSPGSASSCAWRGDRAVGCAPARAGGRLSRSPGLGSGDRVPEAVEIRRVRQPRRRRSGTVKQQSAPALSIPIRTDQIADIYAARAMPARGNPIIDTGFGRVRKRDVHGAHGGSLPRMTKI